MENDMRFLLIEDSQADAHLTQAQLGKAGISQSNVRIARTLTDGIDQLRAGTFDLVLLDLGLPESTGPDTLKAVRGVDHQVPIVVLTGCDDVRVSLDALEAGAQDYLIKSMISPDSLSRSIRYAIQRHQLTQERESLHRRLLENSRRAGMADVASGILHNVGNALNSVTVTAAIVDEKIRNSRVGSLAKASELIEQHRDRLGTFLTSDEHGKRFPAYLTRITRHLIDENESVRDELGALVRHVERIAAIVATQQSNATMSGVSEPVAITELIDEAVAINEAALVRDDVELRRDIESLPTTYADRNKLIQILINLIRNARRSVSGIETGNRLITLRTRQHADDRVLIEVEDNGPGVSQENLDRIFSYGFTTRQDGHEVGLHASAVAAQEAGGSLTVHSDGPGTGACFALELPVNTGEVQGGRITTIEVGDADDR